MGRQGNTFAEGIDFNRFLAKLIHSYWTECQDMHQLAKFFVLSADATSSD